MRFQRCSVCRSDSIKDQYNPPRLSIHQNGRIAGHLPESERTMARIAPAELPVRLHHLKVQQLRRIDYSIKLETRVKWLDKDRHPVTGVAKPLVAWQRPWGPWPDAKLGQGYTWRKEWKGAKLVRLLWSWHGSRDHHDCHRSPCCNLQGYCHCVAIDILTKKNTTSNPSVADPPMSNWQKSLHLKQPWPLGIQGNIPSL